MHSLNPAIFSRVSFASYVIATIILVAWIVGRLQNLVKIVTGDMSSKRNLLPVIYNADEQRHQ